jgi:hypothetical protein
MGHYCKVCGRIRSNESFTGSGHKLHICKSCMKLSKDERDHILQIDEICGFLNQSNISKKNRARLQELVNSKNSAVNSLAMLVLEVAQVKPQKRSRTTFLAQKRPDLLQRLRDSGLIFESY